MSLWSSPVVNAVTTSMSTSRQTSVERATFTVTVASVDVRSFIPLKTR